MRLVTISDYIETCFEPGSRPSPATVRNWIERGEIPPSAVQRRGRRYFIDLDVLESPDEDELVEKVLAHG